jgi:hypothetical protein
MLPMKIIKVEIFSLLNKNWALWKNHDAKNFRHFENFNSAFSFEAPYKGCPKNSFVPKTFWALWEKFGQFGNFYIAHEFGKIVEVEKCFCWCPSF